MKVLALDYGAARTGVAVSDPTGTLARPLAWSSARRPRRACGGSSSSSRPRSPSAIVVGLPLTLRGEHGLQAEETERFVEALRAARRRAGRELRRALHDRARRAARRHARPEDARAAAHLLESYLAWTSDRA